MLERPKSIMIFAAGRGTRMAPLTESVPKPLIKVAGTSLLDHALDLANGIETIVVNTHHLADQIESHLASRDVITTFEPELLETGGGLKAALPYLGSGPVLTLNSDAIWNGPNVLETLMAAWDPEAMDGLLALVPRDNAKGYRGAGDFKCDKDGQLTRGPGLVYAGAQIIRTVGLAQVSAKAFSLNLLWDDLIATGRLFGVPYTGSWCDVGRPENIALAEAMLDV